VFQLSIRRGPVKQLWWRKYLFLVAQCKVADVPSESDALHPLCDVQPHLKGAKPIDLPVEQTSKYQLVVNLKTASVLGFKFLPSILAAPTR
jgi:hypothetical protein